MISQSNLVNLQIYMGLKVPVFLEDLFEFLSYMTFYNIMDVVLHTTVTLA